MAQKRHLYLESLEPRLLLSSYWVDPLGDDTLDGLTPQTAWASPSRGQSSTISSDYIAGSIFLSLSSTKGFLDSGNLTVAGQTRAYFGKTSSSVTLAQPFNTNLAQHEPVFDADILGGDSFEPGDVINLRGGTYLNRPLDFYQSGAVGAPITYRSAPSEQAVLESDLFSVAPLRRLSSWTSTWTEYVTIEDIKIVNSSSGNHGAPGMHLHGVEHFVIDGVDIDISGTDINGDNNAITLFGSDDVLITNSLLRSRQANGVAAWQSTNLDIVNTVIYESFNGVIAQGGSFPAHINVDNSTIYAINTLGAIKGESPGTVTVTDSIIAQTPSATSAALTGTGTGDYNVLWNLATDYGPGWNGQSEGAAGANDVYVDPKFISVNPFSPYFLRIAPDSPAASAGDGGGYAGAFVPVQPPSPPQMNDFNVASFGALGNGVTDDLAAIQAAIDQAAAAGGGRVVVPASAQPYMVSDTIRIDSDWINLSGSGATVKLLSGAGRMDLIQIGTRSDGPTAAPVHTVVEHATVEGLILDGNYRQQAQSGSNNPRGVWIGHASDATIQDLVIRDTFAGVTFGPGSRDSQSIDVTVTDWDHDGFGASGRGVNGSVTDIRFIRSRAVDTASAVKGWEIEEGAQRIYLEDCEASNIGGTGTGFYVRHHEYNWPLLVADVQFVRCSATNLTGSGFIIATVPGSGARFVKPFIDTRNIQLIDSDSDAPVNIFLDVEDVFIEGGQYSNTMGVGFLGSAPSDSGTPRWPVRSVTIRNADIDTLKINAQTGNPNDVLGDPVWPDYQPDIRLSGVTLTNPIDIVGDPNNVKAILISNRSVQENATDNTVVGTLSGIGSPTFSLLDNAGGRFDINGNNLVVADGSLLDHESASSHLAIIQVNTVIPYVNAITIELLDLLDEPGEEADFNNDSVVDGTDIDLLRVAINTSSNDPKFNLNGDGQLDGQDFTYMITNTLGTAFGDANVDFRVDDLDVQAAKANFGAVIGWAGGNFDLDTRADANDLASLRSNIGFMVPAPAPVLLGVAGTDPIALNTAAGPVPLATDQDNPSADSESEAVLESVIPRSFSAQRIHDKLPAIVLLEDFQNNDSRAGAYRDLVDSVITRGQIVLPTSLLSPPVAIQLHFDHTGLLD